MNNLTLPVKFTEVKVETVSPLRCVTRFGLCFSWVLLLVTLPCRAQTLASAQKTMTLEELQQMALQNNPTFKQSAANIQAAEGRKKQSGSTRTQLSAIRANRSEADRFTGASKAFSCSKTSCSVESWA